MLRFRSIAAAAGIAAIATILAFVVTASASTARAAQGPAECSSIGLTRAVGLDSNAALVAGFATTAGRVADWQRTRLGPNGPMPPSQWSAHSPIERVAVCYYNGLFRGFPMGAPSPAGTAKPDYDQIILLIGTDQNPILDAVGHRSTLPAFTP